MSLKVEVSVGEFLDKLSILEIKSERISDPAKLVNVRKELALLQETWAASPYSREDISSQRLALKQVNEALWEIEDEIRRQEAARDFGEKFVALARSVYQQNDRRAAVKKEINTRLGSDLTEEKSYVDYSDPAE